MTYESKYAPEGKVWVNAWDRDKKCVVQLNVTIREVCFSSDKPCYAFWFLRWKRPEENVYETEAEAKADAERWAKEVGYEEYL